LSHTERCSRSIIIVLTALTCACADRPGPAAPGGAAATANSTRAASAGVPADVFPFDIIPLVWGGDPRDQFAVTVGYEATVAQVCADPNTVPLSPGSGIAVATPVGRLPITTSTHEAYAIVYQYGGGIVSDPCAQLATQPIVATGRVTYTVTTSDALDVVAPGGGGPGAAGVEAAAEGVVRLSAGGDVRLSATLRVLLRSDGSLVFDEERVRLRSR
jgi:hypothetical protein